ncbi:MAG: ribosome-associated translation inhibitor RaiA [Proteobacteria bacterium]|nr:ribosome-associated translation inhibitor RaiA [Pseudomonadota bacterium]
MEFVVRAHSVKMDDASRDYAEAKIGKAVAKMTRGSNARVDVEVSKSTHGTGKTRVKVHVVIPHVPSETVHADESEMKAAIDVAADKISRALRRHKEKRRDRARATGPVRDPYAPAGDDDDGDGETVTL